MKKDILKDFVDANRLSFDDQKPSSDVFNRIQAQLAMKNEVKESKPKVVFLKYWWAAAAILFFFAAMIVFNHSDKLPVNVPTAITTQKDDPTIIIPMEEKDTINSKKSSLSTVVTSNNRKIKSDTQKPLKTKVENRKIITSSTSDLATLTASRSATDDWRKDLEASSSSKRLAAVLASGKQGILSSSDLERLVQSMNNDESSNVRLAALSVLGKQHNQSKIKDMILQSVSQQDDPVVQVALLSTLTPNDATALKDQLLSIVQNPVNIEAVRDQAYAALLRSETNF